MVSGAALTWDNAPSPHMPINWHIAPLGTNGLPSASARSLPAERTADCELCGNRPRAPLSTVLVIDGPDGLPVPFLICNHCRRSLHELHNLLESAARHKSPLPPGEG